MTAALDLIFVYGTLMRRFDHPMSKLLSRSAEFLGEGRCPGRLYMIAHYPGLLRAAAPGDVVSGELYRMHDPAALLAELDEYESCGPNFDPPTLYLRETLPVTLADGSVHEAWTYIYNRPVEEAKRIASGRFLEK
ncbi:gamma-glutamylcyclotransferase family protein [Rhodopseudomonas sp. P2A-2r]|uniref:gamma-glutamylcyclotransferase family protein n=1 Tax=unclassified Rhodopseudomonas TaxID=2638247 RepID=UPI002234E8E3|nr:gamma-glutamylcyclotransferase family protein [Rhodopseudomonas sp. P2A-2r]UZE48773.1 gamma-glutamylcyclotransferase [Rhodopseudomonas sp. P2A-2r]